MVCFSCLCRSSHVLVLPSCLSERAENTHRESGDISPLSCPMQYHCLLCCVSQGQFDSLPFLWFSLIVANTIPLPPLLRISRPIRLTSVLMIQPYTRSLCAPWAPLSNQRKVNRTEKNKTKPGPLDAIYFFYLYLLSLALALSIHNKQSFNLGQFCL